MKYLLLAAMLIAGDWLSGVVISDLARKQARDNRIGLLLDGKIRSDIIILGSSRALNNYNPAVIDSVTGKSCYNLGVSGSNVLFHETMLDLVLSQPDLPELIIYNVDDYGALCKMDGIVYRKDVLYPYVDEPFISDAVSRDSGKNKWVSRWSASYRHNVNFINALKYLSDGREAADYSTTNFDANGANLLLMRTEDRVPQYGSQRALKQMPPLEQNHVDALRRIISKCRDQNVDLLLSLPPLYMPSTPGFEDALRSLVGKNVHIVSYADSLMDATDFFNTDHLNKSGARKFSLMIAKEIITINSDQ
jgi:hypothetical protein